jgi:hypothetical protein
VAATVTKAVTPIAMTITVAIADGNVQATAERARVGAGCGGKRESAQSNGGGKSGFCGREMVHDVQVLTMNDGGLCRGSVIAAFTQFVAGSAQKVREDVKFFEFGQMVNAH